jgi:hypothetical protein
MIIRLEKEIVSVDVSEKEDYLMIVSDNRLVMVEIKGGKVEKDINKVRNIHW